MGGEGLSKEDTVLTVGARKEWRMDPLEVVHCPGVDRAIGAWPHGIYFDLTTAAHRPFATRRKRSPEWRIYGRKGTCTRDNGSKPRSHRLLVPIEWWFEVRLWRQRSWLADEISKVAAYMPVGSYRLPQCWSFRSVLIWRQKRGQDAIVNSQRGSAEEYQALPRCHSSLRSSPVLG
ncbi:hypothetical protein LX32DRAFT_430547 [Colletotrichum zoysiae]|uniref:Uncharacterized protein n=1 Tax=Colletotrichum zoysiae TaxID=1216348 RepID=A0AAD9HGM6_9PEZI|nr:hypothetical protein LX32DRAFT_430547 [Colletotrichum zoysiae]